MSTPSSSGRGSLQMPEQMAGTGGAFPGQVQALAQCQPPHSVAKTEVSGSGAQ